MSGYSNRNWCCPFFIWDERLAVHCEGGRLRFPDREAAEAYAARFCGGHVEWRGCTVARSLLRYYERKQEEEEE